MKGDSVMDDKREFFLEVIDEGGTSIEAIKRFDGENNIVMDVMKDILIIHVDTELDHHNSIYIREKADEIIYREGINNIIFNFEKTSFMDSSGIGVIMGRFKIVKMFGGKVFIAGGNSSIRKIIKYSGLEKITSIYKDVDDAIKYLEAGDFG